MEFVTRSELTWKLLEEVLSRVLDSSLHWAPRPPAGAGHKRQFADSKGARCPPLERPRVVPSGGLRRRRGHTERRCRLLDANGRWSGASIRPVAAGGPPPPPLKACRPQHKELLCVVDAALGMVLSLITVVFLVCHLTVIGKFFQNCIVI